MNEEKYPIYFVMPDEKPDGNSFFKLSDEIYTRGFYNNKFQMTAILTEEQYCYFMQWLSNTMAIYIPSVSSELWEFAGFRIKILRGTLG